LVIVANRSKVSKLSLKNFKYHNIYPTIFFKLSALTPTHSIIISSAIYCKKLIPKTGQWVALAWVWAALQSNKDASVDLESPHLLHTINPSYQVIFLSVKP